MESGEEPLLLESLPDEVLATLEVRDAWRRWVAAGDEGLEFIVSDIDRWQPGSTVRGAFLGGDAVLHKDIEDATRQITEACNLVLDFGVDPASGEYRRWTERDTDCAAEIRVSFDLPGFFSLVGTDSTDPTVGPPGGRPGQRSLNLGGFPAGRPRRWQGTVRHEFLHALAFHHEHQNMRGPCGNSFRWDYDPGYQPTQDQRGVFIPDAAGRRPGIYTYLAGAPNHWPRQKVDHNLRTTDKPGLVPGPFDSASVMLYVFAKFFYTTDPSPCAPTGNGIDLSAEDKRGLRLLYPETAPDVVSRAGIALERLGLESHVPGRSPYLDRVIDLLTGLTAVAV